MRVGSVGAVLGRGTISYTPRVRAAKAVEAVASQNLSSYELGLLHKRLSRLREGIASARQTFEAAMRPTSRSGLSELTSNPALNLDLTATAATLESTGEVNATPTSFTPRGPSFTGSSSSLPTIGGEYTGANDDTYTFEIRRNRTVGGNRDIKVDVYDQNSDQIETLTIPKFTAPDTEFTLNSGLTLSLSAGNVVRDDTFVVSVYASVGSVVNPDQPFNGTRNDNPNFENGTSVTSGSFQVNGETISVDADDTINSIAAKISSSAAGVTANFDMASEQLKLTSDTLGSSGQISLTNDTSGFLDAVKLSGATLQPGQDPETERMIDSVARFSGISTGDFNVDGTQLSVDVTSDNLLSILSSIDALEGVSSSYENGRVRLARTSGRLELSDGTSNFFSGIGISPGTHRFESVRNRRLQVHQRTQVADSVEKLSKSLSSLFQLEHDSSVVSTSLDGLRTKLLSAVGDAGGASAIGGRKLAGLLFQNDAERTLAKLDRNSLESELTRDHSRVFDRLFKDASANDSGGILTQLDKLIEEAQEEVFQQVSDQGGHVIDLLA